MLSAHEFAALLVLDSRGSPAGLDPRDVNALFNRSLIEVHPDRPADNPLRLTHEGLLTLAAVGGLGELFMGPRRHGKHPLTGLPCAE